MKSFFLLFLITFRLTAFAEEFCKYEENFVDAEVAVKTEFKGESYSYYYSVKNLETSKLPIKDFRVEVPDGQAASSSGNGWKNHPPFKIYNKDNVIRWSNPKIDSEDIKRNASLDGFVLQSKNRPGPVKYMIKGSRKFATFSKVVKTKSTKWCPGFYAEGSTLSGSLHVTGMTIGPVPADRITGELSIKRHQETKWTGKIDSEEKDLIAIDPLEKGILDVRLEKSPSLDLNKIDMNSIVFGRGNAKPIKFKNNGNELVMEFNTEDVNVLCNADKAIFLTGKLNDGKDLFSGVKLKRTECTEENWAREVNRISKARAEQEPARYIEWMKTRNKK